MSTLYLCKKSKALKQSEAKWMSGLQDMGRVLIMTKHRIQLKMNFTFIESVWEFLSLRFWEKQGENPSQD